MARYRERLAHVEWTIALIGAAAMLWSAESRADGREDDKRTCVAAADQGQLLRDNGKYSEALQQFTACAQDRCPTIVREQCGVWLRQVMDANPTVVFAATDPHGRDLAEVHVVADGRRVAEELDGRPIQLDPGPHQIRFEAPGHEAVVMDIMLRAGDKNRTVSATLGDLSVAPHEPAPPLPPASFWNARQVTSVSLLAAGALSVGGGLAFALASKSEADRAATLRQGVGRNGCAERAAPACLSLSEAVDAQGRDATASTAFYIGGGALAAVAAAVWFVWPSSAPKGDRAAAVSLIPLVGPARVGLSAQMALQ